MRDHDAGGETALSGDCRQFSVHDANRKPYPGGQGLLFRHRSYLHRG